MNFFELLTLIFPISIFVIGCFLIYSAIFGKGVSEPDKNASFHLYAQYKVRGLIGVGFLIGGILFSLEIIRVVF